MTERAYAVVREWYATQSKNSAHAIYVEAVFYDIHQAEEYLMNCATIDYYAAEEITEWTYQPKQNKSVILITPVDKVRFFISSTVIAPRKDD